ncbi:MAG: 4-demethylwyosine synthase TYW1, partial [Thermoplasmata archaeon HGW-Thermoplasmata-2]
MAIDPSLKRTLERQHYKIVGASEHFGVKPCHWMRQKLLYGRACYKEEFYGIKTHQCMQMAPAINDCTHQCVFCWRTQGFERMDSSEHRVASSRRIKRFCELRRMAHIEGTFSSLLPRYSSLDTCAWDEPEAVFDQLIEAQRLLISGYKGDERCDMKLWKEAQNPAQVAISLSGEPTMYPYLSDFIGICKRRGMTTFVVTNGTNPEVLEKMDCLPTQLYVTVAAPDKETYHKVCRPLIGGGWQKLNETLALLPSLKGRTRTAIRHTLVEGWNFHPGDEKEAAKYAKLDEIADPTFIEPKGYVFVGGSRTRKWEVGSGRWEVGSGKAEVGSGNWEGMGMKNMPSHESIRNFGAALGGI